MIFSVWFEYEITKNDGTNVELRRNTSSIDNNYTWVGEIGKLNIIHWNFHSSLPN